ncbi:hypothetical protein FOZ62_018617, partial [Perkinsus olseni]
SMEVELVIKKVSYPMRPSSIPDNWIGPGARYAPKGAAYVSHKSDVGAGNQLGGADIPPSSVMAHTNIGANDLSLPNAAAIIESHDSLLPQVTWSPDGLLDALT